MTTANKLAAIGALVGDPARAAIIMALMDGRALTAGELANAAGITPQTTSGHLIRLVDGGLLAVERQGRHRYHRLASAEVAHLVETMMVRAENLPRRNGVRTGPRDARMRLARTCYDHIAGALGVAIADALVKRGAIQLDDGVGLVTDEGLRFFKTIGLEVAEKRPGSKRPLCRPCLDWGERRPHLAGRLGAAILDHFLEKGIVRRVDGSRALMITPMGRTVLRRDFGITALDEAQSRLVA